MSGILQTLFLGAAAAVKDAYFNLVTLLLNTTATNGAQNNTFLDSSTNNFTITRNGNTTQGTFTPFSQTGWGNYLNGSSYLTTNSSATFGINGDFTYESWVYVTDTATTRFIMPSSVTMVLDIVPATGNNMKLQFFDGSVATDAINTFPINTWAHVALVRSGMGSNNCAFYVNGVRGTQFTSTATNGTVSIAIGNYSTQYFYGYISNLRFCKSAVYSGASFTPSTSSLTTTSQGATNCVLLTCQSNRFVDNSSTAATFTLTGTPSVQAFSPFAPAYITPTTYSNYFDGSGDYLTWPSGAGVAFGTGDFTIEMFICPTNSINQVYLIDARNSGQTSSWAVGFNLNNTGNGQFTFFNGVAGAAYNESSQSCVLNQWNHCVVVRSGTTLSLFTNGTRVYTTTNSTDFNSSQTLSYISRGQATGSELYYTGCMSNVRIVKGTAVYSPSSTTLTVPTSPLTAISGTQLLTCQNSTFIDNSTNNFTISAFGNAQPVASPTPFAPTVETEAAAYSTTLVGGSGYFDGSDYLTVPDSGVWDLSGDFTLELWAYLNNYTSTGASPTFIGGTNSSNNWLLFVTSSNEVIFLFNTGTVLNGTATSTPNEWAHYALCRSGSTIRLFKNGVLLTSATNSTNFTISNSVVYIGVQNGSNGYINGYMSGLRLINGTALYTSSFAPPLAPPTAVTNTSLLLNYTNAGIYDSTAKNDLETVGNAQVSTTQAKFGTTSMYFDGTGDWLTIPYSAITDLGGTTQFTIEFWVYSNSLASRGTPIARNNGSTAAGSQFDLNIETSGQINVAFYTGGSTISINSATGVITTGTWIHVALTKDSSGNYKIFINGTQSGSTTTNTGSINSPTIPMTIGVQNTSGGVALNAYLDDLRITRYARYTTNFTPPTTAFPIQ